MKRRFSKGNSFSLVNSEAAHTCNSLPEKSKGSFSLGRTGTCNALPDVQQKEFTIYIYMKQWNSRFVKSLNYLRS